MGSGQKISQDLIKTFLEKHFRKFWLEDGLKPNDPANAVFSFGHIEDVDFEKIIKDMNYKLRNDPNYVTEDGQRGDEQFFTAVEHDFSMVQMQYMHVKNSNFYGLDLFKCDFRHSTFEDCDFRKTAQHQFTQYDDVKLIRPKFTVDHCLQFVDFAAMAQIEDPEFYDQNDKRISGANFNEYYAVVYNPSFSESWDNLRRGVDVKTTFKSYNELLGLKGRLHDSLESLSRQAFEKLGDLNEVRRDPISLDGAKTKLIEHDTDFSKSPEP